MYSLLLTIVLTTAPPEFEVRTLDGRTLTGPLISLSAKQATVGTSEGPVSLDIDKLMAISRKDATAQTPESSVSGNTAADPPAARIELVDGSSLLAREYTVTDGRARIALADGQTIELPVAGIVTARLQQQSDQFASDWARILEMEVDTDLLVVRKDDTIDYHRGILRDVTGEIVQFELGGDVLPVKRGKVHALVYYRPSAGTLPQPVCRLTDTGGSQWSVRTLSYEVQDMPDDLTWTTCGGLTVTRTPAAVAGIDFSGGKIVYLSDLKPESVAFTPYFGTNKTVPMLAKFYAPREDKNLQSGPLKLNKQKYDKGLALHSRTKVVYRLPDRFRRFKATVGIDDLVRPQGNVRLVISGTVTGSNTDKILLEMTVAGTDPPEQLDVDLTGVRRLSILVDFGENLDVADHLDLCEARVTK